MLKRLEKLLLKHDLIMKAKREKKRWQVEISRGQVAAYGYSADSLKEAIADAVARAVWV